MHRKTCSKCKKECSHIPTGLLTRSGTPIYMDEEGVKWRGLICPVCVPKRTHVRLYRKCVGCKAVLPASRYFKCVACLEMLPLEAHYEHVAHVSLTHVV